jgi:hypothetical protein
MRLILCILLLSIVFQPGTGTSSERWPQIRELESADIDGVTQAIQDEIYDSGYQKEFWAFETSGPRGPEAEFNIYIQPKLTPETGGMAGSVIYKYLPFGEVIRTFVVATDGTAYLSGDPDTGFSWNQPNTRTVYVDDEQICRDKHDWKKVPFELDLKPSAARLKEASDRQKRRLGFSRRESSKPHQPSSKP